MDYVDFLGFRLKSGTVQPGDMKVRAIAEFPTPKSVHDIRRFLGLTNFFRRFIPRYALVSEPLSRLTRKDTAFQWSAEQNESFAALKAKLTCEPVLQLYDPNAETELHTDASTKGLAAMLLQRKGGEWHLVYCVSKKTTDAESNYHSSELELMAIVWAVDRLRPLLLGISFTIVTDCQALVYLNAQRTLKPQIARWYDLTQEFTFTIKHRPGARMLHVDSLSRGAVEDPTDTLSTLLAYLFEVCVTFTVADQVLVLQRGDEELREIITMLEKPQACRTKDERRRTEGYSIMDGRLVRKIGQVLPVYKQQASFREARRTLNPIPPGKRPFEVVHMDHLGPFVPSKRRNQYLLVIVDNLTKFVRVFPRRDTSTKLVLAALREFIIERGLPERIITDRGQLLHITSV
ncbi:hypothetical protein MRX96_051994 [Rhipicephalus microplus]